MSARDNGTAPRRRSLSEPAFIASLFVVNFAVTAAFLLLFFWATGQLGGAR